MSPETEAAEGYRTIGDLVAGDDPAAAEVAYRRSLDFEPGLADVHVQLAATLVRLGRLCEAEGQIHAALRLEPLHEAASRLWAELLLARGRLVEALACLGACSAGGSPLLLTEYGDLLCRLGMIDEAETAYRSALAQEDVAEAHCNLGLVLLGRGDRTGALGAFEAALARAPGLTEAQVNRANVLLELRRFDEAEQALTALAGASETRAPALWALAVLSEERGEDAAAAASREEAVRLWPSLETLGPVAPAPVR